MKMTSFVVAIGFVLISFRLAVGFDPARLERTSPDVVLIEVPAGRKLDVNAVLASNPFPEQSVNVYDYDSGNVVYIFNPHHSNHRAPDFSITPSKDSKFAIATFYNKYGPNAGGYWTQVPFPRFEKGEKRGRAWFYFAVQYGSSSGSYSSSGEYSGSSSSSEYKTPVSMVTWSIR
jgi:hypothetical protein